MPILLSISVPLRTLAAFELGVPATDQISQIMWSGATVVGFGRLGKDLVTLLPRLALTLGLTLTFLPLALLPGTVGLKLAGGALGIAIPPRVTLP